MLNKKLEKALNDQLNFELYSAYIYMSMGGWLASRDLPGHANWMRVQVQEELVHATKIFDFIVERDGTVALAAIAKPQAAWKSPLEAFEHAHTHELEVTRRIHALSDLARKEKDHAVETFLQWFVTEQIEEEANTRAVAQRLRIAGSEGYGLLLVDTELAARVFVPPPAPGKGP